MMGAAQRGGGGVRADGWRATAAVVVAAGLAAALVGGCATRTAAPRVAASDPARRAQESWRVEWVTACELVTDREWSASDPRRAGGLSGLLYEPDGDTFLAISDQDVPRLHRIRLGLEGHACRPELVETVLLRWPAEDDAAREARDFEDLTYWPGGDLLLVNERNAGRPLQSAPGLHRFTANGLHRRSLELPARLAPGPGTGVRLNAALESVAMTPDGARAFIAVEQPLVQDDEAATLARGGASRLFEYVRAGDGYVPAREFALPLDPVPHPGDIVPRRADIGIVALTALADGSLLMLERSFVAGTRDGARASRNDVLLSRLTLERADDVAGVETLAGSLARPVEKQRLASLRDFGAELPAWLATLDNFEGMALGPRLPDGSATLVLVSDDNFNPSQRTAFIVLRLAAGTTPGDGRR